MGIDRYFEREKELWDRPLNELKKRIAELEKENEELKEDMKILLREACKQGVKCRGEGDFCWSFHMELDKMRGETQCGEPLSDFAMNHQYKYVTGDT